MRSEGSVRGVRWVGGGALIAHKSYVLDAGSAHEGAARAVHMVHQGTCVWQHP